MNYTEFTKTMQAEVKERVAPDVSVMLHTARKNNGRCRTGLVISRQGINMAPTIYLEEFYEQYLNGTSVEELAHIIRKFYEKVKVKHSYPFENILSYQKVKEKIVYKLIHRKSNEELLQEVPYEEYMDLAVVYYVLLESTPFGRATVLVRREHLEMWGVSEKEVAAAAWENTPGLLPVEVTRLTEYMYVVTNTADNFGAAVMLYPGIWKRMRKVIGDDFYILPSSIHELILIPASYGMNRMQLELMVEEINKKEVEEEEVLSNTVYYYSGKEDKVTV